MPEFKILDYVLEHMESTGTIYKLVRFSIDQKFLDQINTRYDTKYSLEELETAVDKCFAHEWLEHTSIGGDSYNNLGITAKGVGVATSKRKTEEHKAERSWLKRTSDFVEDHKGVFVVLGFLLTLGTLALKIFGE